MHLNSYPLTHMSSPKSPSLGLSLRQTYPLYWLGRFKFTTTFPCISILFSPSRLSCEAASCSGGELSRCPLAKPVSLFLVH